eukprot:9536718-Karenia_brevis.AAC.1
MPHGPKCVFTQLLDFTEKKYRRAVGLDGGREWPVDKLSKVIPGMTIPSKVWCARHGRRCPVPYVDEHDA